MNKAIIEALSDLWTSVNETPDFYPSWPNGRTLSWWMYYAWGGLKRIEKAHGLKTHTEWLQLLSLWEATIISNTPKEGHA